MPSRSAPLPRSWQAFSSLARSGRPSSSGCCVAALLALAIPCAGTRAGQGLGFEAQLDFDLAQENGQQAVSADFDGDGQLDIAVTMEGYNQGKVEVLFGDGQADFGTSTQMSSYVATGLGLGDFDADGRPDLAATSYGWAQHGIRIWRNAGQRTFAFGGTVSTLATPPVGVATGDFNGDGNLDLAAISEGGGYAVDWFAGNGSGGFSAFHVVPNTHGLTGQRLFAGHLDADPHLDLFAVHRTGAMVLRNDASGSGNFNASANLSTGSALGTGAVADVDGDGRMDLLTAGTYLEVWQNRGASSFGLHQRLPTASGALDLELADLDRDGLIDAVLVGLGGAEIFRGRGDGGFHPPQTLVTGIYPKAVVLGDWNSDGCLDLATLCQNYAGRSSYLAVHVRTPPTTIGTATSYGSACGNPPMLMIPDSGFRPVLGRLASATITSAPTPFVSVALGLSDRQFGALQLPLSLSPFGLTGCALLHSSEWMGLPTSIASAGARSFAVAIPTDPAFLQALLYLQAHAFAPGQNAAQALLSNGVAWSLGDG